MNDSNSKFRENASKLFALPSQLKNFAESSSKQAYSRMSAPEAGNTDDNEWVMVPELASASSPSVTRTERPSGLEFEANVSPITDFDWYDEPDNERPSTFLAANTSQEKLVDDSMAQSDTLKILTRQFRYRHGGTNLWGRKEDSLTEKEYVADENCRLCVGKGYVILDENCLGLCKCVKERKDPLLTKEKVVSGLRWLGKKLGQ